MEGVYNHMVFAAFWPLNRGFLPGKLAGNDTVEDKGLRKLMALSSYERESFAATPLVG